MQSDTNNKQLRSFGVTVGGIFALIGVWPVVFHGAGFRWWAVLLGVCLIGPGLVLPRSLHWPYRAWMTVGHVMGSINTRIILAVIFYFVVTPIGIIRRFFGKDPMGRQIRPNLDSYRITRKSRPASHLTRQY
jgi:hypothetical protein